MAEIGVVSLIKAEGSEVPDAPRLWTIATWSNTSARLFYDQYVRTVNAANSDDALNPTNYVVTTATGVPRAVASVSVFAWAGKTYVELFLDGEMTDGETYNVEVINVRSIFNKLINPLFDNLDFVGAGSDPTVTSAVATSVSSVKVTFSEEMLDNAALVDSANYVFTVGPVLTATSVVRLSGTEVQVNVTSMLDGANYEVDAINVCDIAWNPITANPQNFLGVGVGPSVVIAQAQTPLIVRVTFSKTVNVTDASDPANYTVFKKIDPAVMLSVISAVQHTPAAYDLTFGSPQETAVEYTLQAAGIEDAVGNMQSPNPDSEDFLGVGITPPEIDIFPVSGTFGIEVRQNVSVNFSDIEAGFSGIDLSSVWILVERTDENGVAHSDYAVLGGVFQPAYTGYTRGAVDTLAGITFYLLPSDKKWVPDQRYTVTAYGKDNHALDNTATSVFDTTIASCFEDIANAPYTKLEQKILTTTGLRHVDQLRESLLRACSSSPNRRVQARTLLALAASTDLKGIIAKFVDFATLVDGVCLCDKNSVQDIHSTMSRLLPTAIRAIDEIPALLPEVKGLLRGRLDNNSPVYVVNAMAVIVVSAVVFGEF